VLGCFVSFGLFAPSTVSSEENKAQASPVVSPSEKSAFVPEIFGENLISTGDDESHPAFSPDG
jgi:hypothetical protein